MGRLGYLRLSKRQRAAIWLGLAAALVTAVTVTAIVHIKPVLASLATARVSNTVNRIVVEAVNQAVAEGEINYSALVTFEKDTEGHVTALESNMAEFNRLQVVIADEILARLAEVSTNDLHIPLGTLTGSALLAGRGPSIVVRMQAVGSTTAKFRNDFSSAGINQTKHQILLDVDVYMSILLPGFTTSTKVSNEISVAETIIVGSVPGSYTYFNAAPEELEDYAQEYIMNNG